MDPAALLFTSVLIILLAISLKYILLRHKEISLFIVTCILLLVIAEVASYLINPPAPFSRYGWKIDENTSKSWWVSDTDGTYIYVTSTY